MFILTISRETGSMGDDIALLLSRKMNVKLINQSYAFSNWLEPLTSKHDKAMLMESPKYYLGNSTEGKSFVQHMEDGLKEEAKGQSLIILGMGAQIIFKDNPSAINVRITASDNIRKHRVQKSFGLDPSEAERLIELSDRRHKKYIKTIYCRDWEDLSLYDLCLNTDNLGVEETAEFLASMIDIRSRSLPFNNISNSSLESSSSGAKVQAFVHPAEEEFAKILDMYNIEWQYEPKTFPTEWDAEGNVIKAFTPDFYLPKFNTYIELTTMDQKYVTEKKRKVRRLKELYPEVNINIVFKRDYHSLLRRFGFNKGDDGK